MTLPQSLILALVQGISEFLPISSSGHLNLVQNLLGLTPSLSLDVFLNTATLISVLVFFRRQIPGFIQKLPFIALATLPAALAGLFLDFDHFFSQPQYLPLAFFFTSTLLLSLRFISSKNQPLTYPKAIIIGLFQALALFPGVSRSAATLFAGLLLGLPPRAAFQFSFFLFIPASIGALILNFNQFSFSNVFLPGFLLAFLIGLFCLYLLQKIFLARRLWLFSFYTLALSLFLLFT